MTPLWPGFGELTFPRTFIPPLPTIPRTPKKPSEMPAQRAGPQHRPGRRAASRVSGPQGASGVTSGLKAASLASRAQTEVEERQGWGHIGAAWGTGRGVGQPGMLGAGALPCVGPREKTCAPRAEAVCT